MPYRIDLPNARPDAADRLIELGALDVDVDSPSGGGLAAVMPDSVSQDEVARVLGVRSLSVSAAEGRDADSVWILEPRPIRVGRVRIVPAGAAAGSLSDSNAIQLLDGRAFGTGLHPTTALCLEALQDAVEFLHPDAVLDVGTGSGILALAAVALGVPRAVGTDIDDEALAVAAQNARINGMHARLRLVRGGPESAGGAWPLVLANVLAAPLIEMAPTLVTRLAHHAQLVLSGIPSSAKDDVERAYTRLGLHRARVLSRGGWVALLLQASW